MTFRVIEGGDTPEPWHQRLDEDETSFSLFAGWLQSARPRKAPDYPQIALQYDWASRANAYDASTSLPTTPRGQLERALSDTMTVWALEARKLAKRVREDGQQVLTTKEILMFGQFLNENRAALEKAMHEDSGDNLEGLSDEELEAVLKAKQALSRANGGKR